MLSLLSHERCFLVLSKRRRRRVLGVSHDSSRGIYHKPPCDISTKIITVADPIIILIGTIIILYSRGRVRGDFCFLFLDNIVYTE